MSSVAIDVSESRVLCVDLDGTLIATDLLWESLASTLRSRPWVLLALPIWLLRGRAYFKRQLAAVATIDFATLPYRPEVLAFVRTEFTRGRRIVLATAANRELAEGVSRHLGLFSNVMASDAHTNLKGHTKARALVETYGRGQFDYIGDSRADVACWEQAASAFTVGITKSRQVPHLQVLSRERSLMARLRSVVRALRPHQWLKNLLLVIPAIAAHKLDWPTLSAIAVALASLSLLASGGYVLNDILDVGADRLHSRKKTRPFAAGDLSIRTGILMLGACWAVGFGLSFGFLPPAFTLVAAIYLIGTAAYSLALKREPVLDVMFLAGLYVVRVVGGGAATGVPISTWLLAFTLFVCLSLAFLKRFIEVSAQATSSAVPGRSYASTDAIWLHSAGLSSAYLATVVLAIYSNSADVVRLYSHAERLLLLCPVLLYWATRVWLDAHRRLMHDDPVVAVAKAPSTYVIAVVSAAIFLSAV